MKNRRDFFKILGLGAVSSVVPIAPAKALAPVPVPTDEWFVSGKPHREGPPVQIYNVANDPRMIHWVKTGEILK